ncbi:hypothetical protein [Roseomonas populi]|uniref:Uncharacterized protein n=1 Tax=Roseomonas populi TaxID=3121582 RepID=A0ABT1WXQ2_9PROT|nr:hypothetical protein [Roseomonas pecuniae]MCR0980616.1 hypothetical protein [Roseomonas pecuniae]
MLQFAFRVAVVLTSIALGIVLALMIPDRLLYAERATSFDMVFNRLALAAELGFVLGFGAGVGAAGLLGRGTLDPVRRRNLTIGAAATVLAMLGATLLVTRLTD